MRNEIYWGEGVDKKILLKGKLPQIMPYLPLDIIDGDRGFPIVSVVMDEGLRRYMLSPQTEGPWNFLLNLSPRKRKLITPLNEKGRTGFIYANKDFSSKLNYTFFYENAVDQAENLGRT